MLRRLTGIVTLLCVFGLLSASGARADGTYWADVCANGYVSPALVSDNTIGADATPATSCGAGSANLLSVSIAAGPLSGGQYTETVAGPVEAAWAVFAPPNETFVGDSDTDAYYYEATAGNGDGPGSQWNLGWSYGSSDVFDSPGDSYGYGISGLSDCFYGSDQVCNSDTGPQTGSGSEEGEEIWGISCGELDPTGENCNVDDATGRLTDWRVELDDPDTTPAITDQNSGSALANDTGHWISGATHPGDSLTWSFSDDGGICGASAYLYAQYTQDGTSVGDHLDTNSQSATDVDANDNSLTEMTCNGPGSLTFAPDLASLPTGAYGLYATADNPSQEQSGTSSTLTDGILFVDNNTPTISLSGPSDTAWYPDAQTVTVDASDGSEPSGQNSGIASTTCTDADDQTWTNGGDAGTQSVAVSVSGAGTDQLFCTATNGVGTVSSAGSYVVHIDPQTPKLALSGTKTFAPKTDAKPPTITAAASEATALSGADASCMATNGTTHDRLTTKSAPKVSLRLTSGGKWTVTCTARTGAGRTLSRSEKIDLDAQPLDVPLKLSYRFKTKFTYVKSVKYRQPPANTLWTVVLRTPRGKVLRKTARGKASVRALIKWIERTPYESGDTLKFTLSRKGYLSETGVITIHLRRDPTVSA